MLAKDALLKLEQRKQIEQEVIKLINDIPHTQILLSMPGIGLKTAARIFMAVGDMSGFPRQDIWPHMPGYHPGQTSQGLP